MFFLCLVILLGISVFNVFEKSRKAELKNKIVEDEINLIKERQNKLEASLGSLETETGIEEELRSRFPIKKPGEDYVVILESRVQNLKEPVAEKTSFFKIFLDFFNIF